MRHLLGDQHNEFVQFGAKHLTGTFKEDFIKDNLLFFYTNDGAYSRSKYQWDLRSVQYENSKIFPVKAHPNAVAPFQKALRKEAVKMAKNNPVIALKLLSKDRNVRMEVYKAAHRAALKTHGPTDEKTNRLRIAFIDNWTRWLSRDYCEYCTLPCIFVKVFPRNTLGIPMTTSMR
jgi:hypothetical protein